MILRLAVCSSLILLVGCNGGSPQAASDSGAPPNDGPSDGATDTLEGRYDGPLDPCDGGTLCKKSGFCQAGSCCAGKMTDAGCVCGTGSGCDILHTCCIRKGSGADAAPECVRYADLQCI